MTSDKITCFYFFPTCSGSGHQPNFYQINSTQYCNFLPWSRGGQKSGTFSKKLILTKIGPKFLPSTRDQQTFLFKCEMFLRVKSIVLRLLYNKMEKKYLNQYTPQNLHSDKCRFNNIWFLVMHVPLYVFSPDVFPHTCTRWRNNLQWQDNGYIHKQLIS